MDRDTLSRRGFMGAAAGVAAAGALGPFTGTGIANPNRPTGPKHDQTGPPGDLHVQTLGMQLFTVRGLAGNPDFSLPGVFEMLSDAGYRTIEVGGNYYGRTPAEFKALADEWGLRIIGSHVPGGHNAWRNNLEQVLDDAETLELPYAGIASPASPRTIEGFQAMAEEFNAFGQAAQERGIKFYFHNHAQDFAIENGTVIYDVLLEETDPSLVWFQLDIAWIEAGGQSAYDYLSDGPERYPLFHVKDLEWDEDGVRTTPDNVADGGRSFNLTDVGKGDLDFARIFSALKHPHRHEFIAEHDDAPNAARNPAGEANTSWVSRQSMADLRLTRGRA